MPPRRTPIVALLLAACGGVDVPIPDDDAPDDSDPAVVDTDTGGVEDDTDLPACVATARPPVLRRLDARELRRSLRDLLGVEVDLDLPPDGVAKGFDTVGDALVVSSLFLERYDAALDRVIAAALWRPDVVEPVVSVEVEDEADEDGFPVAIADGRGSGWWASWTDDPIEVEVVAPADGAYRLEVRGVWASGAAFGNPTPRVAVHVDDADVGAFDLVEPYVPPPASWSIELTLEAGEHEVELTYTNPDAVVDWEDDDGAFRLVGTPKADVIAWDVVRLVGPLVPPPPDPAPRAALLGCAPDVADGGAACARAILRPLVDRAWRRPLDDDEVAGVVGVYDAARAAGSPFEEALSDALHAALLSPSFLLRVEPAPGLDDVAVDDHVLAERLSFFVWSSIPDAGLRALADQGVLHEPDVLAAEVERLLADPRSDALVEGFGASWLGLGALDAPRLDAVAYPQVDEALRAAMREESERLFDRFLHDPTRPAADLLDPGEAWLSARLAAHYGLPGVTAPGWVPTAGTPRGGLLAQGAVHVGTSNPTRTSPVKRGAFVLDRLLCREPGSPPANVPLLDEATAAANPRDALAGHAQPACAGCHAWLDPLGLALETFDADGALRTTWPDGTPIAGVDALPDGRTLGGPEALAAHLADDPAFLRCLAEHLSTYATGRVAEHAACALDDVAADAHAHGGSLPALVQAIVASPWVLRQDPEDAP